MELAIFEAIDKAKKMVSPRLFNQFIQIISRDQAGDSIDLTRYRPQRPMNEVPVHSMARTSRTTAMSSPSRPTTTMSTQTNVNQQTINGIPRRVPSQRQAPPRGRMHPQHSQQMGGQRQPIQGQNRSPNQVQGARVSPQHQGQQHQRQQPPQQQQHAAPQRPPRIAQRQPLPQRQPQRQSPRQAVPQQAMNGNVTHAAPSGGGRKPPMTKSSQNGQTQQMMQNMLNVAANGAPPHRRASGAMERKPPMHYNQQQAPSQQVQGQQQQPQGQPRRGPVVSNPTNQVNMQQPYRQYGQ